MGTTDHGLSIDEVDRLLDGHLPAGRDDLAGWAADLASLSAAYDRDVDPVDVRQWATQAAALAGLTPSDNGDLAATSGSNAYRPAPQVAGLPKRRISVLNSIAAFIATTIGKVTVAGALVAATTTGGLAATGNLPGQADAPVPVSVDDDSSDPGVLDADGLDDDETDVSCADPAAADATDCVDDAVDAADEACVASAAVATTDPTTDADADADDATADDPAAADDCETDDLESPDAVDADEQEADDHDAEEVEADDSVSADDGDDSADDSSTDSSDDDSSSDDSSDDASSDSDADEGTGVPQG